MRREVSPAAFYDYPGHVFDAPRCYENTRVAVLEKIGGWVIDATAFIMWLHGAAGAGKSAIARTVAEFLLSRRQLLATFFFSRVDSSRNNIKAVVATLAYKIAISVPKSYDMITAAIAKDHQIFLSPLADQLSKLVIEPLQQLSSQGVTYPPVIIIDGLDECLNHEERVVLLGAISRVAEQHSAPLKFLITSRREVSITRIFDATPIVDVSTRHSLDDEPESMEDVEYFLSSKFDEIRRTHPSRRHIPHDWPSSQVKADLVQKSSGQLIYPATIIRYISSPRHNPTLRLDVILKLRPLSGESPFAQLDAMYRYILLCCENLELALHIIGICLLPTLEINVPWGYGYIFPPEITTPEYIESILGLHPGDVQRGLEDLGSLIEYKSDYTQLHVLHTPLFDFLSDPTRVAGLPFKLAAVYTDLAIWCSRLDSFRDKFQVADPHCESDIYTRC